MEINAETIKSIISELFNKYKKTYIYEEEYVEFLKEKGFDLEQAKEIIYEAFGLGLIEMGLDVIDENHYKICIWRPEDVED